MAVAGGGIVSGLPLWLHGVITTVGSVGGWGRLMVTDRPTNGSHAN